MSIVFSERAFSSQCSSLFGTTKSSTSLILGTERKLAIVSLDQLLSADPRSLSNSEKAIFAKAADYVGNHDPQIAIELLALGVAKEQIIKLMVPIVTKQLKNLESRTPTLNLTHHTPSTQLSIRSQSPKTLKDFAEVYGLDGERTIISTLVGYRQSPLREGIDPAHVLKAAMVIGDRNLIDRAFRQALKFGNFNELTAVAAETKNNSALIQLGRLSIVRFLYFERNHNWLSDGLRSLSEVTGADRQYVEQMLYDLYDLMRSPEILAGDAMRFTENSNDADKISNYYDVAADVLVATLPKLQRMHGDSSARFRYLYMRTNDHRYVDRVHKFLRDLIKNQENIGLLSEAVIQIESSATLLHIARTAEAYSLKVDKKGDEMEKHFFVLGAMRVARSAFVMSADLNEIKNYTARVLTDPRFNKRSPIGFESGEQSLLAPKEVVELFRSYLADPKQISESTKVSDLNELKSWLKTYDYYINDLNYWNKNNNEVRASSKIFFDVEFRHEKESIQIFLKNGEGASPEKILEFKTIGQEKLKIGAYWEAMSNFIAARDLNGLEQTYIAMMTKGRPLDAVYVAFAMEWISTGYSPFKSIKSISNNETHLLIGN
ncbi:MAG: hypothetical protein V4596_11765 [Bdellovibrionota bacterium]